MFQDSRGDLCSCWDAMNNMTTLQHNEIKASFQRSINKVDLEYNNHLYYKLWGFVSKASINHIADELKRIKFVGTDTSACGCIVRTTHRILCACELSKYSTSLSLISVYTVHMHWRRLNFGDTCVDDLGFIVIIPI